MLPLHRQRTASQRPRPQSYHDACPKPTTVIDAVSLVLASISLMIRSCLSLRTNESARPDGPTGGAWVGRLSPSQPTTGSYRHTQGHKALSTPLYISIRRTAAKRWQERPTGPSLRSTNDLARLKGCSWSQSEARQEIPNPNRGKTGPVEVRDERYEDISWVGALHAWRARPFRFQIQDRAAPEGRCVRASGPVSSGDCHTSGATGRGDCSKILVTELALSGAGGCHPQPM